MPRSLSICFVILGLTGVSQEVSSKVDFGEESSPVVTNSSKEDDDVEVKHTIVVSTKLKNTNRRGLHTNDDGESVYTFDSKKPVKDDSSEVPIVKAYKSVETTQIRTPDTRKSTTFPEFISYNSHPRDEYDLYPNVAVNPMQWKPSTFYNNVNWNQDGLDYIRRRPDYQKFHRRVTDDGVREFYCKKCRELGGTRGCDQQRRNLWMYETTTPKMKIDGKLAKLN
ncbi:uncharacterized protein LOC112050207 [Bicyclus anynana]|uniref:Uncharacterized protein LOC112050207 n=1 Tax=Bicyclus anynana TaxID=110368 RepID=A0A6J1NM12_BICAN|nr:uncharacterized protein LOC112050207 [Bicyclus anynana]